MENTNSKNEMVETEEKLEGYYNLDDDYEKSINNIYEYLEKNNKELKNELEMIIGVMGKTYKELTDEQKKWIGNIECNIYEEVILDFEYDIRLGLPDEFIEFCKEECGDRDDETWTSYIWYEFDKCNSKFYVGSSDTVLEQLKIKHNLDDEKDRLIIEKLDLELSPIDTSYSDYY